MKARATRSASLLSLAILALAGAPSSKAGESQDARLYLHERATAGDSEAQYQMGLWNFKRSRNIPILHDIGRVAPLKEEQEALKWFGLAARQNHPSAQYHLGLIHKGGKGVKKGYTEAYKWFSLAAQNGHEEAAKNKKATSSLLSPEELAEANRLIDEEKNRFAPPSRSGDNP